MKTPPLKNFTLALATMVVLLACVEIALRVWRMPVNSTQGLTVQPTGRIHDYFYFDDHGCFRIVPNSSGLHVPYEGRAPVLVNINSQGFRGPEPQTLPATRIVFLGDSIVFDGGVSDEHTFVRLTEVKLNQSLPERNRPAECLNLGTTDAGLIEYVAKVQYHALSLGPKIVVIAFYLNDSRPPQGFLGEKGYGPLERRLAHSPLYNLLLVREFHDSYRRAKLTQNKELLDRFAWVERFNSRAWVNSQAECDRLIDEAQYDWGAAWVDDTWPMIEQHLRSIARLCREQNALPLLICFPASPQVEVANFFPRLQLPQEKLAKLAKDLSLPFLDLLPILRNHPHDHLFADQCHFTSRGNQIVADALAPWLQGIILQDPAPKTAQTN